jgi:signal transduction histidine kinase/ABC-type uncharacterized transport system substrate-binding protein
MIWREVTVRDDGAGQAGPANPPLGRLNSRRRLSTTCLAAIGLVTMWALLVDPRPAIGQASRPGGPPAAALQSPPPAAPPGRRVLLIYGEPRLTPAIVSVDTILRSTISSRSPVPVTFYTEYLDLNLFDGDAPIAELRELLRRKYEHRPIDLIVVGGSRPLRIVLRNRADLFTNAPVVFVGLDPLASADLHPQADITGTWLRLGFRETLEAARRLQPGIRRALVVSGISPVERVWMEEARQQLAAASGPIEVIYLTGLSLDAILERVRSLPQDTIVLSSGLARDGTGRDFYPPDASARIAAAANVPVYGFTEVSIGTGVVGGYVVSFEVHGRIAGDLAVRVLAGEHPALADVAPVPMFDARQLARWRLRAGRLPPESRVLFQAPSLWAHYRWYIIGAIGLVLVQSALIGGLLVQRTQRRRAQQSLAERLRFETLLTELSGILAASSPADTDATVETALRRIVETLGVDWATVRTLEPRPTELRLTHAWSRPGLPPRPVVVRETERPWIFAQLRQGHIVRLWGLASLPEEATVDRQNLGALGAGSIVFIPVVRVGTVVGCLTVGTLQERRRWPEEWTPRLELLANAFAHALERQRSEGEVRDLAGRLLTAQEEERRRIARDLHDDVNQELTAQSISLSTLSDRLRDVTSPADREEFARLETRTTDLVRTVRHLSHSLHPGALQHVGVVAALRGYCRGFEREHGLPVAFDSSGDLGSAPPDVALCLYRVTQEGLGNVARHAKAQHARVTVNREGPDVILIIRDDGRGFDLAEARRQHGLGLISLDERVRVVGGRLTIDSHSQRGTELRIVVPLPEARDVPRDRAAG